MGGIDVLLSARRVGPSGFAYGQDMTDEMLALAEHKATSAQFLKGTIDAIPLLDRAVDVILSNCVIKLSADKSQVLREAFRVDARWPLRRVGRLVLGHLPTGLRQIMEQWVGCVAGALEETAYRQLLIAAGFAEVSVEVTRVYAAEDLAVSASGGNAEVQAAFGDLATASDGLVSGFIRATKPHQEVAQVTSASVQGVPTLAATVEPPSAGCATVEHVSCCAPEQKSSCCGDSAGRSDARCGCR